MFTLLLPLQKLLATGSTLSIVERESYGLSTVTGTKRLTFAPFFRTPMPIQCTHTPYPYQGTLLGTVHV